MNIKFCRMFSLAQINIFKCKENYIKNTNNNKNNIINLKLF